MFLLRKEAYLTVFTSALFVLTSHAKDLYVSPSGEADADGTLAQPYRSITESVEAVRALRQSG